MMKPARMTADSEPKTPLARLLLKGSQQRMKMWETKNIAGEKPALIFNPALACLLIQK